MSKKRRLLPSWRTVAVLAVGIAIGVSMTATPAASHVAGVKHTAKHMKKFFFTKKKTKRFFFTKKQSNARFAKRLYASVTQNGVLHAGNALDAERTATGRYEITFPRDVRGCAGVGNVGFGNTGGALVMSTVRVDTPRDSDPDHRVVEVWLTDTDAEPNSVDSSFHVVVIC